MLKENYSLNDLLEIMRILRSENGCPWDREQTHQSLKKYLIEETYEVLEAIDLGDREKIVEELGDVLLQIVFHSQIGKEENTFSIDDVITGISKKMVLRHTHVFGDETAETADDVLTNWEKIKKVEKGVKTQTEVLRDVPSNLPALMRSYKVQQKAAQVGFDWDNIEDVFGKVEEELQELKKAFGRKNEADINEEMGDLFFAFVNLSRFLKVQPELALTGTTEKFIKRFQYIEDQSIKQGRNLEEMTLEEMDKLWNEAKNKK